MSLLAALVLAQAFHGPPSIDAAPPDRLFAAAKAAPDDVRFLVHVEHVQELRQHLEDYPLADWAEQLLGDGQFIRAWGQIAQLAGVNSMGLIDLVVGESITLMVRGHGADLQWLLATPIDDDRMRRLNRSLKVTVHDSSRGYSMVVVPEHRLLLTRTKEGVLLVCPQLEQRLLHSVLRGMGYGEIVEPVRRLSRTKAMKTALRLDAGQAGVYIAHDEPLGGWSVATMQFKGPHLRIQHRARFAQDAFERPVPEHDVDPSIVVNFVDDALIVVLEPTTIGRSGVELFLEQVLGGQPILSREIRDNLGDIKLFVVGDMEGRLQERQADMLLPTGAMCLKVKNGEIAEDQIDDHLVNLTRTLNKLGRKSFVIDVPNRREFIPGELRRVDLDSFTDWIGNGMPLLNNVDLCWQCLDTPNGPYLVIGTHEQALAMVARALERESERTLPQGKWASCGVANGVRIGQNLESLLEHAVVLAEPGQEEEFRNSLRLMSSLAFGIKQMTWRLARPCTNELQLDVEIELAPPVSAEGQ